VDLNHRLFGPEPTDPLSTRFLYLLYLSLNCHKVRGYVNKIPPHYPAFSMLFDRKQVTQQVTLRPRRPTPPGTLAFLQTPANV
jgi:hypothetical protein